MCQVACLWLGCCKWIYSSSHCHITTCAIGVIEKHNLFFGHNWLSIWIEIQLQFANCIILIESFHNLLKLKSTCNHWIIWSFYLKLIQFWSIIKSPSCLLLFQYHTVLEYAPGQNGYHFADAIFKWIFMNGKFCMLIQILLRFVPKFQLTISQPWLR